MKVINKFWAFKQDEKKGPELRIEGDIVSSESFWGWLFDIDEVTPKAFREELMQYSGQDITVWINSNGGDVYAASAIYTALKEHQGNVTVKIDGTAISAASVIAMAGNEVLMSPTSVMMIHNPWTFVEGEAKDLEHYAGVLREVKETILNAYQLKTGKSRDEISELMDTETWMGADKAISMGFANGRLYEPGEEVSSEAYQGMVNGARMVFNSLRNRPMKLEVQNQKEDQSDQVKEVELAKARLNLEKLRY